jgi:tetraacyldisaccharide 4'-kinase
VFFRILFRYFTKNQILFCFKKIAMFKKNYFLLLFPLGLIYGLVVAVVRSLYKIGVFRTFRFPNLLIIKIGNLSVGGTGKTPHTSFLLSYFEKHSKKIAVVSRGYGRQNSKNQFVELSHLPTDVGDEPLMLKQQFPNVSVVVAKKRAEGLQLLQKNKPYIYGVVLDDAMQHWAVQSDLNILLSTFEQPFFNDFPLPAGRLREFNTNFIRADIIIVTQCTYFVEKR